jgi:cytochrome c-type biogenesis protein CcmF
MVYLFVAWFAVMGNGAVMTRPDSVRKPKLIGGALSHVGFGVLLIGILASSAYNEILLDQRMQNYNQRVAAGDVLDEQGFPVRELAETFMLELNQPKSGRRPLHGYVSRVRAYRQYPSQGSSSIASV